ncbi:MAG: peptidoglycan DD-metalloendopeptidase family protein [Rhodocyclaceae bacterium]|nr:peptidoglycan DD-metalloendopeptidase family protein [Rhodocyclaceae bacterium]
MLVACLSVLSLMVSGSAIADDGEIRRSRTELGRLQQRIDGIQRALERDEKHHDKAASSLARAGRALSEIGRKLRQTRRQQSAVTSELARFQEERAALEVRIEARRVRLARWLHDYYVGGGEARLADFLASRDPNQVARDGYYLQRIGAANLSLIDDQRRDVAMLGDVAQRIGRRSEALAALSEQQRREQRELTKSRARYKKLAAELASRIKTQKREVSSLRLDEQRLGRLIVGLEELAREQASAPTVAPQPPVGAAPEPSRGGDGQSSREPVIAMLDRQVVQTPDNLPFRRLKGRLDPPLTGAMVGRFGEPRANGGAIWKGVFIRAREGAEVRAVAPGEVVFADWLRGFGNLVIIDHGKAYMTVYGNNDILIARLGQKVLGGEAIASVGIDEGSQESGLYFEIRHRGEPVNPLKWVRR